MATTITAGNATNGAAIASDNTGILELKTGTGSGTVALTLGTGQQVGYTAGTASAPSITFTGDTNTGIYSPGADRIGFTTGGSQRGEFDASGNFQFNSGYGSVATAYGCRAWVNFNGTGAVAIRASGNVTSITDNGVGNYTVNFTSALPDVNYAGLANMNGGMAYMGTMATTSCQVLVVNSSTGAPVDVSVVTFGAIR